MLSASDKIDNRLRLVAAIKEPLNDIENLFCLEGLKERIKKVVFASDQYNDLREQSLIFERKILDPIFTLDSRKAKVETFAGDMISTDPLLSQYIPPIPLGGKRVSILQRRANFQVYAICPDLDSWATKEEIPMAEIQAEMDKIKGKKKESVKKQLAEWEAGLPDFGYFLGSIELENDPRIATAKHIMEILVNQVQKNVEENLDEIVKNKIQELC